MFKSILALPVILFALLPMRAAAVDADDLITTNHTERPIEELFKTDVVYPQEKGELEVEAGSIYQNYSGGDAFTVPLSLEYGLTSEWQVEAEWDSYVQHDIGHSSVRGIGDLELGTQYSFMNIDDSTFHIAPRFTLGVPVGSVNKDLSDGFIEYEPAIIFAKDFPELHRTQVFAETGLNLVQRVRRSRDSDDAEPSAHALELGGGFFTLFKKSAATMEFNWTNDKWNHNGEDNELYVTPGILYHPLPNIELGLGVPVGLTPGSDRFDIDFHIVCEF